MSPIRSEYAVTNRSKRTLSKFAKSMLDSCVGVVRGHTGSHEMGRWTRDLTIVAVTLAVAPVPSTSRGPNLIFARSVSLAPDAAMP